MRDLQPDEAVAKGSEPSDLAAIEGVDDTAHDGPSHFNPASSHFAKASPRARMVAALSESLLDSMEAGDLEAARVAHEAIGRLLASRGTMPVDAASVIDIKRGQKPART